MNTLFTIERPYVLFAILLVIPIVALMYYRYKKTESILGGINLTKSVDLKRLRRSYTFRTIFRCLSWSFAVIAFSGISYGTRQFPVQKSGCSVSFVFDISYSMEATDVSTGIVNKENLSRLEASKIYAKRLLSKMDGISVSAVLAKGDGFVTVPLTEDFSSIYSLIDSLSPQLMTSAGSSIGKGIECAISSFPQNTAQSKMIIVFTDGDETDDALYPALLNAARFQIPVTIIGFGSEDGVEVLSGDRKTPVHTFLMANKMKNMAIDVNKSSKNLSHNEIIRYVTSSSQSSAVSILKQINSSSETFSFEVRPVSRHDFFLFISVISFILSYVIGEIDIQSLRAKLRRRFGKISSILLICCVCCIFFSCSDERVKILDGTWAHYNGKYRKATVDFISVTNETYNNRDETAQNYALFGLASTYISLEEYDAALDKLNQIILQKQEDEYKDSKLASSVFYNEGIIYTRKGDFNMAKELFKKSILASDENLDAKINLELTIQREANNNKKNYASELQSVNEEKSNELDPKTQALFNLIRENEQNQWKKMESKEDEKNVLDY